MVCIECVFHTNEVIGAEYSTEVTVCPTDRGHDCVLRLSSSQPCITRSQHSLGAILNLKLGKDIRYIVLNSLDAQ
jgi:hypothetical protein